MRLPLGQLLATCSLFAAATPATAALTLFQETHIAPAGGAPGAALVPTFSSGGPATNDLLSGLMPSVSSGDFDAEQAPGLATLTDDSVDTAYGAGAEGPWQNAYATAGDINFAQYDLGGAYDLMQINLFGGWNDGGRDEQNVAIYLSTNNGGSFFKLTDIFANEAGSTPISHKAMLTDDTGILASGVTTIRLEFGGVENGFTGYTEIDAIAVPEPASIAALGMLGLLVGKRRRR